MKSCSKCHAFKPLAEFDHSRSSRDNHHHRCKVCDRRRDKQRLKDGSLQRSNERWKSHHPRAAAAHRAVRNAIKRGDIQRGPCVECGKPGEHGHHDDYSKPLDVTWLCLVHHHEHHRRERFYGRGKSLFSFIMEDRP